MAEPLYSLILRQSATEPQLRRLLELVGIDPASVLPLKRNQRFERTLISKDGRQIEIVAGRIDHG